MCVCVCVQDSSTIKTLVCVSSEDSRVSVRSLESVLIASIFIRVRNQSIFYTYYMYSKKNTEYLKNVYEHLNLSVFENKKRSDSVL